MKTLTNRLTALTYTAGSGIFGWAVVTHPDILLKQYPLWFWLLCSIIWFSTFRSSVQTLWAWYDSRGEEETSSLGEKET